MDNQKTNQKTRILYVNPVAYPDLDEPIKLIIGDMKLDNTEVEIVSFNTAKVTPHLEYRTYEAFIIPDVVRIARYAAEQKFDAAVIGCFYDPGLDAAREISGDTVIVGPCQASVQIAANICNRFSVIVGQYKWIEQMEERVRAYGYIRNLASMRSIDISVPDLQKDCNFTAQRIIEEGRKAIEEDHAEALILGCTSVFGLYEVIQKELGVPVIDPLTASFKMAEYLGGLKRQFGWSPSRAWSNMPPPEAEIEIADLFGVPPIGNSVIVP